MFAHNRTPSSHNYISNFKCSHNSQNVFLMNVATFPLELYGLSSLATSWTRLFL